MLDPCLLLFLSSKFSLSLLIEPLSLVFWNTDLMEGETTMDGGGHRSRKKWRAKEILDSQMPFLPIGFAVLLDLSVFNIPIINEDMKCVCSDTNWLSYCTWSILVLFCYSTRDASCLEDANLVLLTITTMCSEISNFYMVHMLQNMDERTTYIGGYMIRTTILFKRRNPLRN